MKRIVATMWMSALVLGGAGRLPAADVLVPGKIAIVKDGKLLKVIAKPAPATTFPLPAPGAIFPNSITVQDTGGPGALSDALTGGFWDPLGDPAAPTGYKYKNSGAPAGGPVKLVLVKGNVIKILAKDDGTLNGPLGGDLAVKLQLGADNYCAEFGGTPVKNDPGLVKRKDAPPPGACLPPPCCPAGAAFHSFTVGSTPGDCGDALDVAGGLFKNLACGALYLGGGQNAVAPPITLPDSTELVTSVGACSGPAATLGPTTAATTGSTANCTDTGCAFGAPVPIVITDPGYEDVEYCLIGTLRAPASGSLVCATGEQELTLPIRWSVYTGNDAFVADPGNVIPGSQPCPLCQAGTCVGGANNGMACTPHTADLGDQYPTSRDCPPVASHLEGMTDVTLRLASGTVTWTATTANNDTEVEVNQTRVFSGFCRDADLTGNFQFPPQQCWENGMAIGPACAQPFETCEQRDNGAFGPAGGAVRTITTVGSPQTGITSGPVTGTLAGVFSVPPIAAGANFTNNTSDLPGPAAIGVTGTGALCTTANPCP